MEQGSSCENNTGSVNQNISSLSWFSKFIAAFQTLRYMNPAHILTTYTFTIHFNIILPPTPSSPFRRFPVSIPKLFYVLSHLFYIICHKYFFLYL